MYVSMYICKFQNGQLLVGASINFLLSSKSLSLHSPGNIDGSVVLLVLKWEQQALKRDLLPSFRSIMEALGQGVPLWEAPIYLRPSSVATLSSESLLKDLGNHFLQMDVDTHHFLSPSCLEFWEAITFSIVHCHREMGTLEIAVQVTGWVWSE